ncbi:MAG TPA: hypothetical protein VJ735_04620 [Actinomycetes bacterium]|nr:hypothetical protein [Actinomycetes bacterium]
MAGMAERYWKDLRPSSAAQFRLDVTIPHDRDQSERDLRRSGRQVSPRPRVRAKLRATSQ